MAEIHAEALAKRSLEEEIAAQKADKKQEAKAKAKKGLKTVSSLMNQRQREDTSDNMRLNLETREGDDDDEFIPSPSKMSKAVLSTKKVPARANNRDKDDTDMDVDEPDSGFPPSQQSYAENVDDTDRTIIGDGTQPQIESSEKGGSSDPEDHVEDMPKHRGGRRKSKNAEVDDNEFIEVVKGKGKGRAVEEDDDEASGRDNGDEGRNADDGDEDDGDEDDLESCWDPDVYLQRQRQQQRKVSNTHLTRG